MEFGWVWGAKLKAKLANKSIIWPLVGKMSEIGKNTKFAGSSTLLIVFWFLGRLTWKPNSPKKCFQVDRKSNKKSVGILIHFLMDLGANLAGFGEGFGGQVGVKLGPSGNKTRPHKQSKK